MAKLKKFKAVLAEGAKGIVKTTRDGVKNGFEAGKGISEKFKEIDQDDRLTELENKANEENKADEEKEPS